MADDTFSLIVPFLTDDPVFTRGVEIGMLYQRMQVDDSIINYFHVENQDQIFLMASRLGWRVHDFREAKDGWFWCHLERGRHASNPS